METSVSLSEFQALLDRVLTSDRHQLENISLLGERLQGNHVSCVLASVERDLAMSSGAVSHMVRSVVSVPDRTINTIGTDQSNLPDWLYPAQYCRLLLRNLALCLRSCSSLEAGSGLTSQLYESLYCCYPDHVLSCRHWWRYLVTSPGQTRALLAHTNTNTKLRAAINTLRYSTSPRTLLALFADSLSQSEVLEILLVRGLTWLRPDHAWCLVSYLAQSDKSDHADLADCLVRLVTVWSDEIEIDQGEVHYLTVLSWTVCSMLGALSARSLDRVRSLCLSRLTGGLTHWLESDRGKRQLGMCAASVILQVVGGSSPDWTIDDLDCLEEMKSLTQGDRAVTEVTGEQELDSWEECDGGDGGDSSKISHNKTVAVMSQPVELQPELDSDDSEAQDSDDDDDLPAYDMSEDKPWDKDKKPILYVRDVLEHFSDPDSTQQEECLQKMVEFSSFRLEHEDPDVVRELVALTLLLQNKFDSADWAARRQSALTSVTTCRPTVCAPGLVKKLFDKEMTLDTKFTVLESLVDVGTRLREENSGQLGEFLSLTVSGLCGEGQGWARLQVRGLETSLLTQCVLSLARLVRLAENSPGLARHLQTFTELLLTVAGSNSKTPVQAAVLHALGVVGSLVPPHLLLGGELGHLLATAADWAGSLTGDLTSSGTATAGLLKLRHAEGLRLQVERDLAQTTEIKMTIDKHQIKLK